jgi:hypothetical protein
MPSSLCAPPSRGISAKNSSQKRSNLVGSEQPIVIHFLSTKDGLALANAYMAIRDKAVRKRVIQLVAKVAGL